MSRSMTADELRKLYLDFFRSKGHTVISGSSLIPQNDPTVLFTTAGCTRWFPTFLASRIRRGTGCATSRSASAPAILTASVMCRT